MKSIIVEGGQRLDGKIEISGMKNSALPIIFACILVSGETVLYNVPRVSDVDNALEILRKMGADADFVGEHTVAINTRYLNSSDIDFDLVSKMRASSYLMSTCLARFGSVRMPYPGGCNFGSRPIEQHIKGFETLGAICIQNDEIIEINLPKKIKTTKILLDKISVGATINMIMVSVFCQGTVIIENFAKEPHVMDLISFLNLCGASITVQDNFIKVCGVKKLFGKSYRIYSDTIEALTFATCVGVAKGQIVLQNAEYGHIKPIVPVFEAMNIDSAYRGGFVYMKSNTPKGVDVITAPYPAFPTDLHPQFSALLCYCEGGGCVTETIFGKRFAYVNELRKMGANIELVENVVKIKQSKLIGAELDATDLRAGASLIVASLGASGKSIINNVNYIDRGYENIVEKLSSVGAKINYHFK